MRKMAMAASAAAAMLTGCHDNQHVAASMPVPGGDHAAAILRDAGGATIGRASVSDAGGGLRVTIDVHGMPRGLHGAHIHAVGACDAPGFTTAGGHWNPTDRRHGSLNPAGPHEGDLPNLVVGADGRGTIGAVIPGASVAALLDADGAAIIVHADPDDLMTDPSGNSGGRIACGVLTRG